MKKQIIISTAVIVSALTIGGVSASAADGGTYNSDAKVSFEQDKEVTPPVDPTNPGEDVTPLDPDGKTPSPGGTAGPLSIDFASSFSFDKQLITTKNMSYPAAAQLLQGEPNTTSPNYVQVTDKRGGAKGWTLTVQQNKQFTSESGTLDGAVISFKNGEAKSAAKSAIPSFSAEEFKLNFVEDSEISESQTVLAAKKEEAAGTWVYRFGDETTKDSSVVLEVPGTTTKYAEDYETSLTWTLSDVPYETAP